MSKKKTKDQLLAEAQELLRTAYYALCKERLLNQGGNTRLPHETRMFARHFSPDGRVDGMDEFASGHGTYHQWESDYRKLRD